MRVVRRAEATASALAIVVLTALAGLAVTTPARAEPHVRDGLCLGVGFGSGSATINWKGSNSQSEWSGTVAARAGWAVSQPVMLGLEFRGWSKDYDIATLQGDVPVKFRLSGTTAAVTYFPGNEGFLLKGGLGVAIASVEVTPPAGVDYPVSGTSTKTGFAALVAMGYEFRVSRTFALGAELDTQYLKLDSSEIRSVFIYGLAAELNWYW